MKIAVSASAQSYEGPVDSRFGRCSYFVIYDDETKKADVIGNGASSSSGGAGIQSAQIVAEAGAQVVLTGNIGPNAFRTLKAAGLAVFTGVSGSVNEAVQRYLSGGFDETDSATVDSHFGMR